MHCAEVVVGNQGLKVTLPGGATIPVMVSETNPSNLQITKTLLGQASGAMAPLVPMFNIVAAMLALKDFAEAVPKVLTNPGKLAEAIPKLLKKIAVLAQLVPQLSVPLMVLDLIDVALAALQGTLAQLEAVAAQEARIAAALALSQVDGNGALLEVTVCASGLLVKQKQGIQEGLGALGTFFGLMNTFMELIGLPPIPDLSALPDDTAEAIDSLQTVVKTLQDIRATIPIP